MNRDHILAEPDSMSTGTIPRPSATGGIGIGFDRAGRLAGMLTPISTASLSICWSGALSKEEIFRRYILSTLLAHENFEFTRSVYCMS